MARFDRFALDAWDEYEYEEEQGQSWDKHVSKIDTEANDIMELEFTGSYCVGA